MDTYEEALIEDLDEKKVKVKGAWYNRGNFRLGYAQTVASSKGTPSTVHMSSGTPCIRA